MRKPGETIIRIEQKEKISFQKNPFIYYYYDEQKLCVKNSFNFYTDVSCVHKNHSLNVQNLHNDVAMIKRIFV